MSESHNVEQPDDGLTRWEAEASGSHSTQLSTITLSSSERMLMPFTTTMLLKSLHYLNYPSLRGFVHCVGASCVLCRTGHAADRRDLWPVYDAVQRAVGVLLVPENMRARALRPELIPVLRRLKVQQSPLLVSIRRLEFGNVTVRTYDLPAGADDGAAIIEDFRKRLEAGELDLGSVCPCLTNQELAAIPEVATAMRLRGIQES